MLKDLMQLAKFRYGTVVMVTYWVNVKECFLGGPSLSHVSSVRWMGVSLLGMGFLDIQGLILSHLWTPLLRVHLLLSYQLFACHLFPNPFFPSFQSLISFIIFKFEVLPLMVSKI